MISFRFAQYMLKKILTLVLMCCSITIHAQFITARATHASGILSNNLIETDFSKSLGGEIYFSKSLDLIPLNYNLGLDYMMTDSIQAAYAVTGLSFIIFTPSGFSATNVESVTYTTFNWLHYADLNIYNGVQLSGDDYVYAFAGEVDYNIGYLLGKQFFIHTGFGGRYTNIPSNKNTALEFSSVDFMLKFGILWKLKTRRYKQ